MPKCPECGDLILRKDNLNTHLKSVHGDSKMFKCHDCKFESARKDVLKRHIESVHNNATFKCIQCEFVSNRKDKLKSHFESKHNNATFKCPHCEFVTNRKDNLKRHQKIKHGDSATPPKVYQPYRLEPEKKKRRIEEDDLWGEPLSASDIEMFDAVMAQPVEPERPKVIQASLDNPEPVEPDEQDVVSSYDAIKSAFNGKMTEKTFFVRGHKDPVGALNTRKSRLEHELQQLLKKVGPQKWYVAVKCRMYKLDKDGNRMEVSSFFHGAMQTLLRSEDFEDSYQSSLNKIWQSFDVYLKRGSGWLLERVEKILLNTYTYTPIKISSYIPTPKALAAKLALINVQNEKDKKCFEYSVNAALHHEEIDQSNAQRPGQYTPFMGQLEGCKEPMTVNDIPRFEKLNNLPISVYRWDDEAEMICPLYMTKMRGKDPINLLLIEGEEHYHFVWIKNYNRLLHCEGSKHAKVHCPYCCYGFRKDRNGEANLAKHKKHCRPHGGQRTTYLEEGENKIQFKEWEKMQKLPFTIYADFETINKKVDNTEYIDDDADSGTKMKTNHQVSGFTFYTVSDYFPTNRVTYRGEDAGEVFLKKIQIEKRRLLKILYKIKPMDLTVKEERSFNAARECHICNGQFQGGDDPNGHKVRDHCHFTGKSCLND